MINNEDNNEIFNEHFWTFMYLIVVDNKYLNIKGKLLKEIVLHDGNCKSGTVLARSMGINVAHAHILCQKLIKEGTISIKKIKGKNNITFSNEALTKTIDIQNKILGELDK